MSTYAIIESGSKQYVVEPKSVIEVEKFEIPENQKEVSLDKVLFIRQGDQVHIGTPVIKGASVLCDFVGNYKTKKVINFRFRRRKSSRRKQGHRQHLIQLVVKEIRSGK
jgi:large subunit ribosomal protein L21